MVIKITVLLMIFFQIVLAQDNADVKASAESSASVGERTSKQLRQEKPTNVSASWGLLSMWMPSKLGASAAYSISEKKTVGFEYQYQSVKFPVFKIDIGSIKEEKYGFVYRGYGDSNSFYSSFGIMRYSLRAQLAASLFSISVPIAPLFDVSSIGPQFGLGNQWNWENGFSFGIDWFNIYFHMFNQTKNTEIFSYLSTNDRDNGNKMIDLIMNIPIIEILKIQAGYSF